MWVSSQKLLKLGPFSVFQPSIPQNAPQWFGTQAPYSPRQSWHPPLVAPCAQRGGLGGPSQGQLCPRSLTIISSNNVPKRCHHTWKIMYPFPYLKKQYVRGSFQLYVFSGWCGRCPRRGSKAADSGGLCGDLENTTLSPRGEHLPGFGTRTSRSFLSGNH